MHEFVISDIDDKEKVSQSIPKPVPDHVLHEVYRTVEGEDNYVVKLGEIKHAVTDNIDRNTNKFPLGGRVIPIQEPSPAELDLLLKYAADISKSGINHQPPVDNGDAETQGNVIDSRKVLPEELKPMYSHVDGDFLYEYFE